MKIDVTFIKHMAHCDRTKINVDIPAESTKSCFLYVFFV